MTEVKYLVKVQTSEKPAKAAKEAIEVLKGGVSGKAMSRMKKEFVFCPVVERDVPFLECFACVSFVRRVKGEVHCAGIECRIRS